MTASFSPPDKFKPVRGPVAKINKLSGDKESIFGFTLSNNNFVATPLPPIYFFMISFGTSFVMNFLEERSTSRILSLPIIQLSLSRHYFLKP